MGATQPSYREKKEHAAAPPLKQLLAGDVVIWDPKPELALCLVAIVRSSNIEIEAIRDWRAESKAKVERLARLTARTTGGRILVWRSDTTLDLLRD